MYYQQSPYGQSNYYGNSPYSQEHSSYPQAYSDYQEVYPQPSSSYGQPAYGQSAYGQAMPAFPYGQQLPPYASSYTQSSQPSQLSRNVKNYLPQNSEPLYSQGLVSDIEFLNFENEGEFKKYRLQSRNLPDDRRSSNQNQASESQQPMKMSGSVSRPNEKFFLGLLENMRLEKQIQELKVQLVNQPDFNIPTQFTMFESPNNSLTLKQFTAGLNEYLKLPLPQQQVKLIYRRFAKISLQEIMHLPHFAKIFMPAGISVNQQVLNESNFVMAQEQTSRIIQQLFKVYAEQELCFENVRQQLQKEKVNLKAIFNEIDTNHSNEIGLREFENALKKYSRNIETQDALLLFLRFDKEGSKTIDENEFRYELTPKT